MVCDRCVMAVKQALLNNGLTPKKVELGKATVEGSVNATQLSDLNDNLKKLGFELLDDRNQRIIEQIKNTIIKLVHYNDSKTTVNLSTYLQTTLRQDYSALSKLFSEYTSKTIEKYFIEQRIERVKELITYNELSLSQIALKMGYSSVAYLSGQFKNVTGMTPTQFKKLQGSKRKSLDHI